MSDIHAVVEALLGELKLPGTEIKLITLVRGAELTGTASSLSASLQFGVPLGSLVDEIGESIRAGLQEQGVELKKLELEAIIPSVQAGNHEGRIEGVKNIIAVASGKGGVGKSTTTVNLALALAAEGAQVGVLDADIYGPSQSHMLGISDQRPTVLPGNRVIPIEAHGVVVISMGNLVTENTPMIWRGPMVSGALQQLLENTQWQGLDYLLIDMPPGTGDIALTLAQRVPVSGSVIVTTPQDIALLDAKKGIEMFAKVHIPVFGVVENMAVHRCSNCGHEEHIFGEAGGVKLAEQYGVDVLGSLPLDLSIRESVDKGCPSVAAESSGEVAFAYRRIARELAARCCWQADQQSAPEIVVE
jgi:ATP-binding protein involved in chromosome partitioning